jgi:hypothetical protein
MKALSSKSNLLDCPDFSTPGGVCRISSTIALGLVYPMKLTLVEKRAYG